MVEMFGYQILGKISTAMEIAIWVCSPLKYIQKAFNRIYWASEKSTQSLQECRSREPDCCRMQSSDSADTNLTHKIGSIH